MRPCHPALLAVLCVFAGCWSPASGQSLVINPVLVESRYCLEPQGAVTLRLRLRLTYHNDGSQPLLLPRFYSPSRLTLVRVEDAGPNAAARVELPLPKRRMLDTTTLEQLRPNPELFDVIPPGGTFDERVTDVPIVARAGTSSREPLAVRDYLLRVVVDHWPDRRESGERLRDAWRGYGLLWIDPVETSSVKVRVNEAAEAAPCKGRVD